MLLSASHQSAASGQVVAAPSPTPRRMTRSDTHAEGPEVMLECDRSQGTGFARPSGAAETRPKPLRNGRESPEKGPLRPASLLRHPGLTETGEIRGFEQGADFRHPEILDGLHAGDAKIATVAHEFPGFSEFGGGALGLAFEGIGGGEAAVRGRYARLGAARFFRARRWPRRCTIAADAPAQSRNTKRRFGDRED